MWLVGIAALFLGAGRPLPPGLLVRVDVPPPLFRNADAKAEADSARRVLTSYCVAELEDWNRVPHIAFRDRTGTAKLRDGTRVDWTIRPGGIAFLEHPGGEVTYLLDCRLIRSRSGGQAEPW